MRLFYLPDMSRTPRRRPSSASRPKPVRKKPARKNAIRKHPVSSSRHADSTKPALYTASQRELTTKRRGELAELAFTLKAASLGFGVSKPFGDSERYDAIIDARQLNPRRRCHPDCPLLQALRSGSKATRNALSAADHAETSPVPTAHVATAASAVPRSEASGPLPKPTLDCPALKSLRTPARRLRWCPPQPLPPIWRVQVKCSTQLNDGLYHLNAHRRTGGRAVPYLPGEIDFLAAYIIPEDTWYILPLEAFLGSTSLLFRRRADPKPGLYDAYREAWHLLRPK